MNIACEKCGTSFVVDESRIPPEGLLTRCTVCSHTFTIHRPSAGDPLGANEPADLPAPLVPPPPTGAPHQAGTPYGGALGPPPPGAQMPPDIAGLPAAPDENIELVDLPAPLADRAPLADLPGLPGQGAGFQPTGGPSGLSNQPPPLESLARDTAETPNLPGLPGQPPPLESMPPARSPGSLPSGALPDLPAPKGGIDMSDFDLDASPGSARSDVELPMPAGITDLPMPAGVMDLPAPSGVGAPPPRPPDITDFPMRPQGADLPRPVEQRGGLTYGNVPPGQESLAGSLDEIPIAGQGPIALDLPGGTIDLPTPSSRKAAVGITLDSDLPAGTIDLPGPASTPSLDAGQSFEEILDLPRPHASEAQQPEPGAAVSGAQATADLAPPTTQPKGASAKRAPKPQRVILLAVATIGAFALIGGIAVGLFTEFGFFGSALWSGDEAKAGLPDRIAEARKLLLKDTFQGYAQAAETLATAAKQDEEETVLAVAEALRAEALLAQNIRFGDDPGRLTEAESLLQPFSELEEPPVELQRTRVLLTYAKEGKSAIDGLTQLSGQHKGDAMSAAYLGWAQLRARHYPPAKVAFERALALQARLAVASFGLAQVELAQDNPQNALAWAAQTAGASDGHAGALLLMAQLKLAAKRLNEAETTLKRALTAQMTPPEKSQAHTMLGTLAEANGQVNEARKQYELALKLDRANIPALLAMGKLALHANQYAQANKYFGRALKLDPRDNEAALLLAETALAMGKHLDARKALKGMLKKAPKSPHLRYALARVEHAVGSTKAAISLCNEAIKRDSKYFEPYLLISRLYLEQGDRSSAFAALNQANTLIPGAKVRNALGEAHLSVGELDKAQVKFEEALAIDTHLNVALFNLANTLRRQGKLSAALARYQELAQRDHNYPALASNMGLLYLKLDKPQEAAQSYDTALKVDAPPTRLRLDAGNAFLAAEQYDKAVGQAKEVLEMHEQATKAEALALRAEARMGLDDLGEALVEIGQAIGRDPEVSRYHIIRARIFERLSRLVDAIDAYEEAIKRDPKRVDLRFHRARLLVRAGTVKDGLVELNNVIRLDPNLAEAYLFKGVAYADLGQEAQAARAYQLALQKDPNLGEAHLRLGQHYLDRRQASMALTHLRAAAKHSDEDDTWRPEALYLFGRVAMQSNRREEAIEAFQLFLKVAPTKDAGRPEAKKALAKLGAAAPK